MKLTILGNNGPFAAPGGACSSYLLQAGGARVLLDCGPGALAQLERVCSIAELDALVLSHLHYDHVSDLFSGMYNLQQLMNAGVRKSPLTLLLPDAPEFMRAQFESPVFAPVSLDALARGGSEYRVGELSLSFMPVRHPLPAFAVRAQAEGRTLVYTGDTNTCDGLKEFCTGADMLLCDIGLTHAQWSEGAPHLSAKLGGDLAAQAGAGALVGTHIHPRADRAALLSELRTGCQNACLAVLGEEYEI